MQQSMVMAKDLFFQRIWLRILPNNCLRETELNPLAILLST